MSDPSGSKMQSWQWALIGSGATLVLLLSGFGLYKLVTPTDRVTSTSGNTPQQTTQSTRNSVSDPAANSSQSTQLDGNSASDEIRSKESAAKTTIGSMNRAQQAFFIEQNQFSQDLGALGLGISPESDSYLYKIRLLSGIDAVQNIGLAKSEGIKSFTGIVQKKTIEATRETTTISILCMSDMPISEEPAEPQMVNGEMACPTGYSPL